MLIHHDIAVTQKKLDAYKKGNKMYRDKHGGQGKRSGHSFHIPRCAHIDYSPLQLPKRPWLHNLRSFVPT